MADDSPAIYLAKQTQIDPGQIVLDEDRKGTECDRLQFVRLKSLSIEPVGRDAVDESDRLPPPRNIRAYERPRWP